MSELGENLPPELPDGSTKRILAISAIGLGAVSAFGLAALIYHKVHSDKEIVQPAQEDFSENI